MITLMPTSFTPISALAGGILIGIAVSVMLWIQGRIAGVSGILGGAVLPGTPDRGWRLWYLAGLPAGAVLYRLLGGDLSHVQWAAGLPQILLAGFLVGFGTRLGNGCTSGHGVCGLARFSIRSLVAVVVFMGTAMLVVALTRPFQGVLP